MYIQIIMVVSLRHSNEFNTKVWGFKWFVHQIFNLIFVKTKGPFGTMFKIWQPFLHTFLYGFDAHMSNQLWNNIEVKSR